MSLLGNGTIQDPIRHAARMFDRIDSEIDAMLDDLLKEGDTDA